MRNVSGCLKLCMISLIIIMPIKKVSADSCDYKIKAELNKSAFNVKYDYEINPDNRNFDIGIYNIVGDIYVSYSYSSESSNVSPSMTTDGTYKFSVPVLNEPYKIQFVVKSLVSGCSGDLRKFELTVPIRNKFYDTDNCKRKGMEDYYYCKEWITDVFKISDKDIEKKIETKLSSINKKTTTKCVGCEEKKKNDEKIKAFRRLKKNIIIVICIGIVIDIIYVVVKVIQIRRYRI